MDAPLTQVLRVLSVLIVHSGQRLTLPIGLLPICVYADIYKTSLSFPILSTCLPTSVFYICLIRWTVKTMKFLIVAVSSLSRSYPSFVKIFAKFSNTFRSYPSFVKIFAKFSNTLSLCSSFNIRDNLSHPHNKLAILLFYIF